VLTNVIFNYVRSKRSEAFKNAFVSVAVLLISLFCLNFLPNIKANEQLIIYGVLAAVFIGMWIFLVIPNLLKNGRLEYYVDQEIVRCLLPDGDGYTIRIEDIDQVEKIRSMTRDNYVDYWINCKKGEDYLIPAIFGLSPHKVLKAIEKAKPELIIKKKVDY